MIKIWDLWIRLFHWSLAIAVSFLLLSGETGIGFFDWHRLVGEIVLALLIFRLLWSFLGSSNASLYRLIVNPKYAISHLRMLAKKSVHQERGHSAAGGFAVLAMLSLILLQAVTGLFIADEDGLVEGAFNGLISTDLSNTLYDIHHFNAGLLQLILLLHVLMIAIYFFVARQNLIKPMITGVMNWTDSHKPDEVKFGNFYIGFTLAIIVVALFFYGFKWH